VQLRESGMRWCLVLCLIFAACGAKPSEDERVRKTVASWDGALALAAGAWTRGELPKHFVRNAADAATEELSKQAHGPAASRALALAGQLKDAAEHDDRAAAARLAATLEKEAKAQQ
jgi:hypothetical protein